MKKIISLLVILFAGLHLYTFAHAEEKKIEEDNSELNFFAGNFDFSDAGAHALMYGFQHQDDDKFRDGFGSSFLKSKISPISGGFVTGKGGLYIYTGAQAEYDLGLIKITPSFAPGLYSAGDGKDLGDIIEFKSEIKFGVDLFEDSNFGYSYSHISNNDWGAVNPGSDNQSLTFSSKF